MSNAADREEPITVTDKRRIDPDTGQVRDTPSDGPAPSGPAPDEFAGESPEEADNDAQMLADQQPLQAH